MFDVFGHYTVLRKVTGKVQQHTLYTLRSLSLQLPCVVTYTSNSEWAWTVAFEVVVCLMDKCDAVKNQAFYLVLTNDQKARVALQFMSPRMPVLCNVIVGFTQVSSNDPGLAAIKSVVKDECWPVVMESDSLPPIDWYRTVPCNSHTGIRARNKITPSFIMAR